jgi:hypothetical protein
MVLVCLKKQQYAGQDVNEGVKKPLNAFLGELYFGEWDGVDGVTKLMSEQVCHHPPITACRLWCEEAGVEVSSPLSSDGCEVGSVYANGMNRRRVLPVRRLLFLGA